MRILVPVDFSECSINAAKTAASIARKTNSKIFLLHIVSLPAYFSDKLEVIEQLPGGQETLQLIRKKFESLMKLPFMRNLNSIEVLLFENVFQTIVDFATENQIDLIVMGSHGASGFREFFIGSNTQKVVRVSEIPVLTIKYATERFQVTNVLFATDFEDTLIDAFERFTVLFEVYKPKIHFLKVITKDNFETSRETQKKAENIISKLKIPKYSVNILNHHNISEGITEFAETLNPSLIAISTEGRSSFYQIFNESIAERLVNRSKYPVLSVKLKEIIE